MPFSDYRPDLMGKAELTPSGAFEAGAHQSFSLVYTAGAFGIDDTGSLKIGFRFATDFGPLQFADPTAQGYTTAEASNGARLDLKWEFKRNIRPWSRSLHVAVADGFLAPGDTITIRFGDRRFGSPGVRLQTWCERAFEFRVFADPIATYDYVALPESPTIAIVPGPPASWHAVLPSCVRAGEPFRLGIRAADAWNNPADRASRLLRLEATSDVAGLPPVLDFPHGKQAVVVDGLVVNADGDVRVRVLDDATGETLSLSSPFRVVDSSAPLVHFWGDTHGQSNETLGTNTARDYFTFGRDVAFLDVIGHQGNDFQITQAFWRELNELTAAFDRPGRFICIPGYEWSANTAVGGDRNVHFRHEGETIHRSSHAQIADRDNLGDEATDAHDARALFRKLEGRDCVVVAHVGGRQADIAYAHHALEKSVEIHSDWGTFEWILHDAFACGYRVGIVANSDGHKGRPGASYPGASFFGSQGGLTCFLAPRLDRQAIFDAMRARRHYATTGNRAFVSLALSTGVDAELFHDDPAYGPTSSIRTRSLGIGDIARVDAETVDLQLDVVASAPIERIDIFDGFDLIETVRPYAQAELGARIRVSYEGAENKGRGRATKWDGTLKLDGNAIGRVATINNWNLERGVRDVTERSLTWSTVTTGNFGAIDLWLDDPQAGSLSFVTAQVSGEADIAAIGIEPTVFDAGGLGRRIALQRLPDTLTQSKISLRRTIILRQAADTRLYVRIQQEDGHRIWTSPVYLLPGAL